MSDGPHTMPPGERIPMLEAVAQLRDLGLTPQEIGEAFARTGESGEDPLAVAREILGRPDRG